MHLYLFVLIFPGIAHAAVIEVNEGDSTTITCDLSVQYPTWTGPDGLADPLTNGQTINEGGMEWVNNKDLKIVKAMLKHDGNYTCSDNNGNSKTAEVDVQYFSAWATLTEASPENTTSVLTCICHSNPACRIHPIIVSHSTPDREPRKTTFYPCEADPSAGNRTMCSVIATLGMAKEYNGLMENTCEFKYKENEQYLTLSKQNIFYFPPTYVNITADKVEKTITLNCSTDSSNPVAVLSWYKGLKSVAKDNSYVTVSSQKVVMDAEYNGKNISQSLDIDEGNIKEGEKVFCCAKQVNTEICASFLLDPFRETSDGYIPTAWISLLVVCVTIGIL